MTEVRAVIAANNDYRTIDNSRLIYQQMDACILIELSGIGITTKVLMISQTGIDRRFQSVKLFFHMFLL